MPTAPDVFADLVRAVHAIGLAGAQELRGHDLTPAQYQILTLVQGRPGLLQRELTEVLGVTKGNVSQLVTRLEDAGLIDRVPAGAANRITLTTQGDALVRELVPAHRRFLEQRFAVLTPHELEVLADLVTRLADPR